MVSMDTILPVTGSLLLLHANSCVFIAVVVGDVFLHLATILASGWLCLQRKKTMKMVCVAHNLHLTPSVQGGLPAVDNIWIFCF